MLDTGALSPEVKKLFAAISRQAEEYEKAFKSIDLAVAEFKDQKEDMNNDLSTIRSEISNSINSIDKFAKDTIQEFRDKIDATHSLYQELDKVDKLKLELYDLRDDVKSQSSDLSTSLIEFNTKADRELANTISFIRKKLENSLDDEISKIESKVARRIAAFEKNQKVFESRIRSIDTNIRSDVRKLAGEIDYAYNSITEMKADLANYIKPVLEKMDDYDQEIPRISQLLDNVAAKVKDRLGTIADAKAIEGEDDYEAPSSSAPKVDKPESYDAGDGNYDDSFEFEENGYVTKEDLEEVETNDPYKMSEKKYREHIQDEIQSMEDKAISEMRKGYISMVIAILALIVAAVELLFIG